MKSVTIEAKTFAEMLGITEGELIFAIKKTGTFKNKTIPQPHEPHKSNNRFLYSDVMRFIEGEHEKPRGSHRMMPSTGVKITTIIS
ncbi:hypothetical protein POY31_26895 [Klebsiella pneumoniae]|uniref:hypothetical protein n=1 Tax=Klebsiella pneumoniae TaxID=573 RepID=UPI001E4059F7|nr:hypothetical protein [Klebsiella pneumoniae]